jgi:hypothetical protein
MQSRANPIEPKASAVSQSQESPIIVGQRTLVPLPDLTKVDRTIAKEPAYKGKAGYCLLVFGPQAKTRIWLVEDGDTLYVDRNANGDLTRSDESFEPVEHNEFMTTRPEEENRQVPYRSVTYKIGELAPSGGSEYHTKFTVTRYQIGDKPANYVLSVWVNGTLQQYAGWAPLFTDQPGTATIVHFGGPVVPQPVRRHVLTLSDEKQELHIRFGTPGLGENSFASVAWECIPVKPTAEIRWPAEENSPGATTLLTVNEHC